ncbi:MAG: hypothetical protein Q8N63_00640 [Nanoarchaeota archaeon]|nr:hypothetical protein [Nanoarchaeota archaeon]
MKYELRLAADGNYVLKIMGQTEEERVVLGNFYDDCGGASRKITLRHEVIVTGDERPHCKSIESITFMTDLEGGNE